MLNQHQLIKEKTFLAFLQLAFLAEQVSLNIIQLFIKREKLFLLEFKSLLTLALEHQCYIATDTLPLRGSVAECLSLGC